MNKTSKYYFLSFQTEWKQKLLVCHSCNYTMNIFTFISVNMISIYNIANVSFV